MTEATHTKGRVDEWTVTPLSEHWHGKAMIYYAEIKKMEKALRRYRRNIDRLRSLELENQQLKRQLDHFKAIEKGDFPG